MGSRRGWRAVALGLGMAASGVGASLAAPAGMLGSLALSVLLMAWFASLLWGEAARSPLALVSASRSSSGADEMADEQVLQRLLLDAAPTPLIAVHQDGAQALNRAARTLFGTDSRILPLPRALIEPQAAHLRHEGRRWRIDRVQAQGGAQSLCVAALIDVESETNLAEARASAELIEVLGHELLNGLAPIVSLAESARIAAQVDPVDAALLEEILGPLARRSEGLQRFAQSYRQLASLPAPIAEACDVEEFLGDLEESFVRRWPHIKLDVRNGAPQDWRFDRDQLYQALWALLHNGAEAAGRKDDPLVGVHCRVEAAKLVFWVTDSGDGLDPASAPHIFRPFHTTKPGGSGIGLTLARQITQAHGGKVEVVAVEPTTFALSIP